MPNIHLRNHEIMPIHHPLVMGIINVSPNSFYNAHHSINSAFQTACQMIEEGADILDIGGEATNPFIDIANPPSIQQEIDRLIPLIEKIKKNFKILISVDTSRAPVMRAVATAGADMINDQRALQLDEALATAVELDFPVCLMHLFDSERMPGSTSLTSTLEKIKNDLKQNIMRCLQAGLLAERIILDPGFGQGHYRKNVTENFYLLSQLSQIAELGYPLLCGWSRKSMIGDVLKSLPQARLFGSVAAETLAIYQGAHIIRTHDVRATKEASVIAFECLKSKGFSWEQKNTLVQTEFEEKLVNL